MCLENLQSTLEFVWNVYRVYWNVSGISQSILEIVWNVYRVYWNVSGIYTENTGPCLECLPCVLERVWNSYRVTGTV